MRMHVLHDSLLHCVLHVGMLGPSTERDIHRVSRDHELVISSGGVRRVVLLLLEKFGRHLQSLILRLHGKLLFRLLLPFALLGQEVLDVKLKSLEIFGAFLTIYSGHYIWFGER